MKTLNELREERKHLEEKSANYMSDLPVILILKRQSIRRYPDGQTVGLYYNDRLNRYIAIPFSDVAVIDAGAPE